MAATQVNPAEARHEARVAVGLLLLVVVLIAIATLAAVTWGLVALTFLALGGTFLVFAILIAYAAGL